MAQRRKTPMFSVAERWVPAFSGMTNWGTRQVYFSDHRYDGEGAETTEVKHGTGSKSLRQLREILVHCTSGGEVCGFKHWVRLISNGLSFNQALFNC